MSGLVFLMVYNMIDYKVNSFIFAKMLFAKKQIRWRDCRFQYLEAKSFTECEVLVKLQYYCCFIILIFSKFTLILSLFCEKDTPMLLLEIGK